ncbi:MAG: type II secretion system F family protein [Halothiobacillaceae bacterium]
MPIYVYKARDQRGQLQQGQVEAASTEAAASLLGGQGLIPLEVREKKTRAKPLDDLKRRFGIGQPGLEELILFSRQMYSLTHAGVPIIQSLTRLADSTANPRFAEVLREIVRDLEGGRDVASSFARYPAIFGTLYISMLRVGELSGRIDEAFLRMYEYLDRDKVVLDRIKSAIRYPSFVVIAILIAIGVLTVLVIPAFAKVFAGFQLELPLPTRMILAFSGFMAAYWHIILGGIVLAVFAFRRWIATEKGRLWWDRVKLRIPKIGDILLRATLARFTRALSMALGSGVPITQALIGVAHASDNMYLAEKVLDMRMGIERGGTMLRSAIQTGLFTPVVLQMLAVGEETGQVDTMMREVADFYDREVEYDIAHLSAIIEPILTVVVGVMVLMLALGVFLPMWELTQLASRR